MNKILPMSYYSRILRDGPLAYYRLNEASGTSITDSSGNANTATATGSGVTYSVAGSIVGDVNKAMTFTAASSGHITVPSGVNPTGSTSIECWVKVSGNPTEHDSILANYSSNAGFTQNYGFGLGINTNRTITFEYCNQTNGTTTVTSAAAISTGSWHFLVGVWNGTTMVLYVDNVSASTTPANVQTNTVNQSFIVAGSYYADDYFNGSVDEAAIFNKALTANQVAAHYLNGLGGQILRRAA